MVICGMNSITARVFLFIFVAFLEGDHAFGQSLAYMKKVTTSNSWKYWIAPRIVNGRRLPIKQNVTTSNSLRVWKDLTAPRIVDGNYDRDATTCRCCIELVSYRGLRQWVKIDLGEINMFTRVVVYGPIEGVDKRRALAMYLDAANNSMATIEENGQGVYHFNLGRKHSARRIKLVLIGTNETLVVCEVDVFDDSIISTGSTVELSSVHSESEAPHSPHGTIRPPDLVECMCCASTLPERDPWFRVHLGDVFYMTYMQLQGRTDNNYQGQSFENMAIAVDGDTIHTTPTRAYISYYELFLTTNRIGKHVTLTLRGKNRQFVMCKLVIYGERIISIRKDTHISSRYYNWAASRAVDGDFRTLPTRSKPCASTAYQSDPWIRVDLGREHKVSRIAIYGRTDGQYSDQSFSNMTVHLDESLVYTLPNSGEWIDFYQVQLTPARLASSVKLTLVGRRKQLVICELLVYGDCNDGFFGERCASQCHCKGEPCNTISGLCPSGVCKPGYRDKTCSKPCRPGRHGQNCSMTCGHCKNDISCDHATGHCEACESGYAPTDPFCKTVCRAGRYGQNCSMKCGHCKKGAACNHETGHCDDCEPGYTPTDPFCKAVCELGRYGQKCAKTCGHCKGGVACNDTTGHCDGCDIGYILTDPFCNTECENGTYGQNCSMTCGQCKDDLACNHTTGHCDECETGYVPTDPFCNKETGASAYQDLALLYGPIAAAVIVLGACIGITVCCCLSRKQSGRQNEAEPRNVVQSGPSVSHVYDVIDMYEVGADTTYTALQE